MKVTIDTKEDSVEDIKKVIHILTHLIERKCGTINLTSNVSSETNEKTSAGFMNMFGDDSKEKEIPDSAPGFSNLLNLAEKKEEGKEEKPKVQLF